MKRIFLYVFSCVIGTSIQAQETNVVAYHAGKYNIVSRTPVEQKEIAKAGLEFIFDYRYLTDTMDVTSEVKDMMILQVTFGMSKFWSYRAMQIDSLLSVSTVDQINANPQRYVGGETFSIYKGYPQGKYTTTDKISSDWFIYEENIPEQEWTLDSLETKEILGYKCRRAECDFRGRHYIAWYSDSIPVADGPWKFWGLPGFILEACDKDEYYKFTLVGINPNATRPLTMPDVQYNHTTRGRFYNTKRKYDTDPAGYMSAASGVEVVIKSQDGTTQQDISHPVELQYDYIERDYRRR